MSIKSRSIRITFNEVVRCARIIETDINNIKIVEISPIRLKEPPIIFRPRGQILSKNFGESKVSIFNMECAIMSPPPKSKVIDGWFIDNKKRVYYECEKKVMRTSTILSIDDNIITTHSGSIYVLGKIDIPISKYLSDIDIPEFDPLSNNNIQRIINATSIIYPETHKT